MPPKYLYGSLARITDLRERDFDVLRIPREDWATGDYVVGEVVEQPTSIWRLEVTDGRTIELMEGDIVVGALGTRKATLQVVGDWHALESMSSLRIIGSGGLMGKLISKSPFTTTPARLVYQGHVHVEGQKMGMRDYVLPTPEREFTLPVVLVIGTSMSAGKTTAAKVIVRLLRSAGLNVVGAKLTGSGRYHDILSLKDAGAMAVFDFVDVGLPTTVCPSDEFRRATSMLLSRMAGLEADVAVIEVGASPLEPYNGDTAMEMIDDLVKCTVVCASDPYAVVGVIEAHRRTPDVVTGIATNTSAGIDLIQKLTGVPALNVRDSNDIPKLDQILKTTLEL